MKQIHPYPKPYWRLWILLSAMVIAGFSCNKDEGVAPGFDMAYQREFTIPAGIGVFDVHHFQLKNIPSNWEQYLNQHGKSAADIHGVVSAQASIGGVFGDVDLSVIDRISLRVYDEANPNDYLEIAYRDPAPLETGNVLALIPSLADAQRFFSNPRFAVDVVIWLRRTTQDVSDIKLDLTMRARF